LNKFLHERFYKQKFPVIVDVSFPESTEVPAHTGLLPYSIAEKEKEDTEKHKIVELYEFLKDSRRD